MTGGRKRGMKYLVASESVAKDVLRNLRMGREIRALGVERLL